MYKNFLLIICLLFFFNVDSAFAYDSILTDISIGIFLGIPLLIFITIGFIFAGGVFIIGGILVIPTAIYYKSVEQINNITQPDFINVILCPAALDLELDFDKDFKNKNLIVPFDDKELIELLDNLPALPHPERMVYKQTMSLVTKSLCTNCTKKDYSKLPGSSEVIATGIWKPIQAFTYYNDSYVNLIQFNEDLTYKTMITEFDDIYPELTYNKQYIFKSEEDLKNNEDVLYKSLNVRNLCTYLKEKSVHKLKTR